MSNVRTLPLPADSTIPDQLRDLAEIIESGKYGVVHSLTWVADCGGGLIEVGLLGASPLPGATAHLMLAVGMRKLELIE